MLVFAASALLLVPGLLAAPSPQLTGEIRSYHQVGDKIKGEYSRLHPDGSVTKTWAFGDAKNGLQYKTYQMDPLGNVKNIASPQGQQAQQLDQKQQQQVTDPAQGSPTAQSQNQNPGGAQNVPPGVNWFLQQPMMSSMAGGVDPFSAAPFPAPTNPQNPTIQDPLLNPFINNPFTAPTAANPQNPTVQDPLLNPFINNPFAPQPAANPLLGTNNPLWNWWNF